MIAGGRTVPSSLFHRSIALRRDHSRIDLAIKKYSLPQFEIQQTPDAIAMIAMSGAMLSENLLDRFGAEQSACLASWLRQQIARSPRSCGPASQYAQGVGNPIFLR